MSEGLTPEQTVRLLRAKAAELEHIAKEWFDLPPAARTREQEEVLHLKLDVALIATLLADFMERVDASLTLYEAHTENLIERVYELEGGDDGGGG